MPYLSRLTLWIFLLLLTVIGFGAWIFYKPIKRWYTAKNVRKAYYFTIRNIADFHDYYLINEFSDGQYVAIDHIIGADKFIYLVFDFCFRGAVEANAYDDFWIYHHKDGGSEKVSNPIRDASIMIQRFSVMSGIPNAFLIGIVLVNDDCFFTPIQNSEKMPLLVPISRLRREIASSEASNVKPLSKEPLADAIRRLSEIKERNANVH